MSCRDLAATSEINKELYQKKARRKKRKKSR